MVYLSANGEVIGQFEESELPSFLAAGRIGPEAFFWREGMAEWRPLRELVLPPLREPPTSAPTPAPSAAVPDDEPFRPAENAETPEPEQPAPVRPAPVEPKPAAAPAKASAVVRKVFLPRAKPAVPAREPRPAAAQAKSSPFIIPARPAAQPAAAAGSSPAAAPGPEDAAPSTPPAKSSPFVIPARPARPAAPAVEPSPVAAPAPADETAPSAPAPPEKRGPFVIPPRAARTPAPAEPLAMASAGPDLVALAAPTRPADQPPKRGPFVVPPRPATPAAGAEPGPVAVSAKTPLPAARNPGIARGGGVITAPPKPAAAPSAAGPASGPAPVGKTALPTPRMGPPAADGPQGPAPAVAPAAPAARPPVAGAVPRRRGFARALLALLGLLLAGGLGAAAWWFWPATPPALTGEVRLAGPDGSPVPVAGAGVFLVSREELVARWRAQLAEVRGRGAEADQLLEPARATHREKVLALELAARISELGDEYNMPDAEQLRADRDAAQAEEAAAAAEVAKLTREMESTADATVLLRDPPEALARTETEASGAFNLPLPASTEGLAVLVVAAADEGVGPRGWLVPFDGAEQAPAPVRLSAGNALDSTQIEEIAAAESPAPVEN